MNHLKKITGDNSNFTSIFYTGLGRSPTRSIREPTRFRFMVDKEYPEGRYPNHRGELVNGSLEVHDYSKVYDGKEVVGLEGEVVVRGVGRVTIDDYAAITRTVCEERKKGYYLEITDGKRIELREYCGK